MYSWCYVILVITLKESDTCMHFRHTSRVLKAGQGLPHGGKFERLRGPHWPMFTDKRQRWLEGFRVAYSSRLLTHTCTLLS